MNLYRVPEQAVAITPSDTAFVDLAGIYIGGAGNVTIMDGAGNTTLFTAPPVGTQIMCRIVQVKATGTTASAIVGFKAR